MKKIWCIIMAMIMLFVVGCSADHKTEDVIPNEDLVPEVEYTIYLSGDSMSVNGDNNAADAVGVSDATGAQVEWLPSNCSFDFSYTTIDTETDLPSNKTLYIAGNQYDCDEMVCMNDDTVLGKQSKLQEYGKTVVYFKSGEYHIHYLVDSGRLVRLTDTRVRTDVSGDFTEKDARVKSEAILKELYGEKCIEYYSDRQCEISVINNEIMVQYTKHIGGCKTNDRITLFFNKKGELSSLYSEFYGCFEKASAMYSSKQLKNAETVLFKHLDSVAVSHQDARLLMSTQGKCYLEVRANCGTEEKVSMRTFYINVD